MQNLQFQTLMLMLLPSPKWLCFRRCLSVCLLATLRKNFRTDLHESFREGWQWTNEQLIKFWWRSGSPSGYTGLFSGFVTMGDTESGINRLRCSLNATDLGLPSSVAICFHNHIFNIFLQYDPMLGGCTEQDVNLLYNTEFGAPQIWWPYAVAKVAYCLRPALGSTNSYPRVYC